MLLQKKKCYTWKTVFRRGLFAACSRPISWHHLQIGQRTIREINLLLISCTQTYIQALLQCKRKDLHVYEHYIWYSKCKKCTLLFKCCIILREKKNQIRNCNLNAQGELNKHRAREWWEFYNEQSICSTRHGLVHVDVKEHILDG